MKKKQERCTREERWLHTKMHQHNIVPRADYTMFRNRHSINSFKYFYFHCVLRATVVRKKFVACINVMIESVLPSTLQLKTLLEEIFCWGEIANAFMLFSCVEANEEWKKKSFLTVPQSMSIMCLNSGFQLFFCVLFTHKFNC